MNRAPTGVGWWSMGKRLALREEGLFPTGSPPFRLISPLGQMGQEYRHPARKYALFAFAHVLDFLRNVVSVEQFEAPGTDERCSASVPATPSVPGRSMMSIQPRYRHARMSQHPAN